MKPELETKASKEELLLEIGALKAENKLLREAYTRLGTELLFLAKHAMGQGASDNRNPVEI